MLVHPNTKGHWKPQTKLFSLFTLYREKLLNSPMYILNSENSRLLLMSSDTNSPDFVVLRQSLVFPLPEFGFLRYTFQKAKLHRQLTSEPHIRSHPNKKATSWFTHQPCVTFPVFDKTRFTGLFSVFPKSKHLLQFCRHLTSVQMDNSRVYLTYPLREHKGTDVPSLDSGFAVLRDAVTFGDPLPTVYISIPVLEFAQQYREGSKQLQTAQREKFYNGFQSSRSRIADNRSSSCSSAPFLE